MSIDVGEDFDWGELGQAVRPFFSSSYLDSPVLITPRLQFLTSALRVISLGGPEKIIDRTRQYKALTHREKAAWSILKLWGKLDVPEILDADEYPTWIHLELPKTELRLLSRAEHSATILSQTAEASWLGWLQIPLDEHSDNNSWIASRMDSLELNYYLKWIEYDKVITKVAQLYSEKKHRAVKCNFGHGGFIVTNLSVVLVKNPAWPKEFRERLLTWDQFLMFKDCFFTRAQVLSACRILYTDRPHLPHLVKQQFDWQESCLIRYRNTGYEILKQTEALAKAYLSIVAQDEFGVDGPFNRMLDKVREKERGLGATDQTGFLCDEYAKVLEQCDSIIDVVELFGIQKLTGHPLIDAARGGRVVSGVAREPDKTRECDANQVKWAFQAMFLEHYVFTQGWPHLEFTDKTTKLHHQFVRRSREIPRNSYPLSDWSSCRFGKVFEFDFAPNYLELMDDKAISQYRSNIAANWNHKIPLKSHRRLLIELISRKEMSAREIVYRVMRRDIPLDWLIICLYPKEKELKEDPRMFSMLVFEMRLFFTLAESNIASSIFKYLPEQTMTDSRKDTLTRFLRMTEPRRRGDDLTLFIEIDLSKWNSRWRELVVHKVGDVMDDLFGLPGVYTYAHEFYASCMMVVRTREDIPNHIEDDHPEESDLLWYNHLGGTEGIIQKHWTAITLAVIYSALRDTPYSWTLSGQGDNQVLSISFRSDGVRSHKEQLSEVRELLLSLITREFAKVNQEVKPEECLESTRVITYSKDVFVNGVYYPTSLKFHSRLFPQCAQDFPSVRSAIGAIFSTALAGSERTHTPLRSLHLAYLQASLYLMRVLRGEGIYGKRVTPLLQTGNSVAIDSFVRFALSLPSDIGGFPVATWVDFVYKGGSDPLGKSLSSLIWMRNGPEGRVYDRILSQLDTPDLYQDSPDILSLLKDPYSLPLQKTVTPIEGITNDTMKHLRLHIKTRELTQITSETTEKYLEKLKVVLSTARPFNPLVMRDILDCSVYGITDTLSRMFVATRTLQAVARNTSSGLIPKLLYLEVAGIEYILNRFRTLPSSPWRPRSCYVLTESLRKRWKTDDNPAPVGLTTHLPFDIPVYRGDQQLQEVGIHGVLTTDIRTALNTRGRFFPYIGGKTREKRSEHGYRIINTDTTSQAFRKLQLISSQAGGNPVLRNVIDLVGLSRSNTILSEISPLLPSIHGGTVTHRYAARVGHQEANLLGAPNFPSHCMISSDKSGKLSGGIYDFEIMFPEHFLALLWALREIQHLPKSKSRVLRIATEEVDMTPVPDVAIEMSPDVEVPLMRFPDNALVFVPDIKIQALPGSTRHLGLAITGSFGSLNLSAPDDMRMVIEAWARSTLRDGSLSRQSVDHGSDLFASEIMDIAELISCGVNRIIDAFSNVIADDFIALVIWTQWIGVDRWRTFPAVLKLSSTLASTISPQVTHPLLRKDPGVRRLHLYDRPTYTESNSLPQARLSAEIARQAILKVEGLSDSFLSRKVLLTDEGGTGRPSEVLFAALARIIRQSWSSGELTVTQCKQIVDRQLRPTMRSKVGEADKIRRMNAACRTIAEWARRSGKGLVGLKLEALSAGQMTVSTSMSAREALRLTRRVIVEESMMAYTISSRVHTPMEETLVYQLNCIPDLAQARAISHQHTARPVDLRISSYGDILSKMRRHANGRGTTGKLSVIRWRWIAPIVTGKRVLIVGSGLGGIAVASLEGGAVHAIGLDLQSTMPLRPHRFVEYIPPLLLESGCESQYTQDPSTFLTTGDWTDSDVSRKFLENDSGSDVIVIDIEGAHDLSLDILWKPVIDKGVRGTVITRTMMSRSSVEDVYGALSAGGGRFRMLALEGCVGIFPVCIITDGCPVTQKSNLGYRLDHYPQVDIFGDPHVQSNIQGSFTAAARNLINLDDITSAREALQYIQWLYVSSKGQYQSRLGYRKWTDVLWAVAGLWWIMLSQHQRIEWIQKGRIEGVGKLSISGEMIEIIWSRGFENHLLKVCSACLTLEEVGVNL